MPNESFNGLRVLSLESRRAREVEKLIRTYGGEPLVVPAMCEAPLESNAACLEFGRALLAGEFDLVIFLTGAGVRAMMPVLETTFDREAILDALRRAPVVVRGVKPLAPLRELNVPVAASSADPSTWHEVLAMLDTKYGARLGSMRVALQEYGATNTELVAALRGRCASLTQVPVYQWTLPDDLGPLRDAIRTIIAGRIDVALFMTAVHAAHLFQIAEAMGETESLRRALRTTVVVSVGPATSEELARHGIAPDLTPTQPRMGIMINEAARDAASLLAGKRNAA